MRLTEVGYKVTENKKGSFHALAERLEKEFNAKIRIGWVDSEKHEGSEQVSMAEIAHKLHEGEKPLRQSMPFVNYFFDKYSQKIAKIMNTTIKNIVERPNSQNMQLERAGVRLRGWFQKSLIELGATIPLSELSLKARKQTNNSNAKYAFNTGAWNRAVLHKIVKGKNEQD